MTKLFESFNKAPMVLLLSLIWYLLLVSAFIYFSNFFYIGALSALIFLHHGNHELIHSTLIKGNKFSKQLNIILGVIGYSIVGHNFFLLKKSHLLHHSIGRYPIKKGLVDWRHKEYSFIHYIEYYFLLFGGGYWWHLFGGYFFLIGKKRLELFFDIKIENIYNYIVTQIIVSASIIYFFIYLDLIYVYLSFGIYWGIIQNAPHYGLEISRTKYGKYASYSYKVNKVIHFLFFGTAFSHFEHHVSPSTPGCLLNSNDKNLSKDLDRINIYVVKKNGFLNFLTDMLNQFKTPKPILTSEWRYS